MLRGWISEKQKFNIKRVHGRKVTFDFLSVPNISFLASTLRNNLRSLLFFCFPLNIDHERISLLSCSFDRSPRGFSGPAKHDLHDNNWYKYFYQVKLWSSQLWTQFLQLRKEAWKIQDFNGVWTGDVAIPVRRSNQLSYEATDVGSWSFVGSNVPVRNESTIKWYIWNGSYMNCGYHNCFTDPFHIYHFIVKCFYLTCGL